ncbi:MAG: ferredoxin family protein [Candidatus Omnitrophica bacterium]|nr:ferredoxin family protein [Candidatus Omnitrophota bacterium]
MTKIIINRDKCKGCLLCIKFCPKGLISKDRKINKQGYYPVYFKDDGDCLGCMFCALICPDCCIEVYK